MLPRRALCAPVNVKDFEQCFLLTLMHDCMRLSGMFFMLAIGGGSAEMKHLTRDAKNGTRGQQKKVKSTPISHGKVQHAFMTLENCICD